MPETNIFARNVQIMMDHDPFSQWLGIEVLAVEEGYCRLRMQVRPEMLNGFGTLHGGVSYAFADSALAFAGNSRGTLSVALSCSMTYPNPARTGDILIAETKEMVNTGKTGTYDIEVKNKTTNALVGLFRGTVYRTSRKIDDIPANQV